MAVERRQRSQWSVVVGGEGAQRRVSGWLCALFCVDCDGSCSGDIWYGGLKAKPLLMEENMYIPAEEGLDLYIMHMSFLRESLASHESHKGDES